MKQSHWTVFCFVAVELRVRRPQEGDWFAVTPTAESDGSLCRVKGTVWRQSATKPVVNFLLEHLLHEEKHLVLLLTAESLTSKMIPGTWKPHSKHLLK